MPRPPRPWYRSYSEELDNAKTFALGTARPDLYFSWRLLLDLANITTPRGYLPADITDIAFALRQSPQKAAEIVGELQHLKFIDLKGKRLYMHKWHDWNPDSDANLTPARAKRHSGTPKERGRNAVGTSLERVDKEIEEEKDKEEEKDAEQERENPPAPEIVVPVVRAFERCFGRLLSPMEIESIRHLDDEHPRDRIDYALREAAELGKRSVRYVQSICENQERSGDDRSRPEPRANNGGYGSRRDDAVESTLSGAERAFIERVGFGASRYVDPPGIGDGAEGVGAEVAAVGLEAP